MKKIIVVLLTIICLITIGACGAKYNESQFYLIGKVVELKEETMLIEVIDKGNCGVGEGDPIYVSTEKIAGVLANDLTAVTDNYLRIEFDGSIMETSPMRLGEIFKIDITNEKGESIE